MKNGNFPKEWYAAQWLWLIIYLIARDSIAQLRFLQFTNVKRNVKLWSLYLWIGFEKTWQLLISCEPSTSVTFDKVSINIPWIIKAEDLKFKIKSLNLKMFPSLLEKKNDLKLTVWYNWHLLKSRQICIFNSHINFSAAYYSISIFLRLEKEYWFS